MKGQTFKKEEVMEKVEFLRNFDFSGYEADFADIRISLKQRTSLFYQDCSLHTGDELRDEGAFIRVLKNGRWAYAATNVFEEIPELLEGLCSTAMLLPPEESARAEQMKNIYRSTEPGEAVFRFIDENPSVKSIALKKELTDKCLKAFEDRMVVSSSLSYQDYYEIRIYCNSSNGFYAYDSSICGMAGSYVLKEDSNIFSTSCLIGGGNTLEALENPYESLRKDIEEAKTFLGASVVESGEYPVVLSPKASGVFAHESFGHKSEADFMLGDEKMKKEWKLGMKVGSDILSIIDDPTYSPSPGNILYDDEGIKGEKTYLVKDGVLAGRLHSRQTADDLGELPKGNGRGMGYSFEPIVRMTTTYIEPREKKFQDLLKDIDYGIYIKEIKHGSGMSTFTIAPDRAYVIRNGKIEEPVKVSVISGTVFETLGLIDGIADDLEVPVSPFTGCGKMEQFPLNVGIGGPSIRVKKMKVS
jgi:TldD protein